MLWSLGGRVSIAIFQNVIESTKAVLCGVAFQKHKSSKSESTENLNIVHYIEITFSNVWARNFAWNFKGYLWNFTQNSLPIHWKMYSLLISANLRAPRFMISYAFFKRPRARQNTRDHNTGILSARKVSPKPLWSLLNLRNHTVSRRSSFSGLHTKWTKRAYCAVL